MPDRDAKDQTEQLPEHDPSAERPPDDVSGQWPTDRAGAHAGRPDQGVKHTTGAGAGGATEWGGGNAQHPSRIKSKPPGH